MRINYIAQQKSPQEIGIYNAETGGLVRTITLPGTIYTPPVISGNRMSVAIENADGSKCIHFYNTPNFGLSHVVPM